MYKNSVYNDLPILVKENDLLKNNGVASLIEHPFVFDNLITTVKERQNNIEKVKIAFCIDITEDVKNLINTLQNNGIIVEEIKC